MRLSAIIPQGQLGLDFKPSRRRHALRLTRSSAPTLTGIVRSLDRVYDFAATVGRKCCVAGLRRLIRVGLLNSEVCVAAAFLRCTVVVYTLQDNLPNPIDTLTFTLCGVADFTVQGWNGSAWITLVQHRAVRSAVISATTTASRCMAFTCLDTAGRVSVQIEPLAAAIA
jgi:hypothetical protein